jgi:hypothetical protein
VPVRRGHCSLSALYRLSTPPAAWLLFSVKQSSGSECYIQSTWLIRVLFSADVPLPLDDVGSPSVSTSGRKAGFSYWLGEANSSR